MRLNPNALRAACANKSAPQNPQAAPPAPPPQLPPTPTPSPTPPCGGLQTVCNSDSCLHLWNHAWRVGVCAGASNCQPTHTKNYVTHMSRHSSWPEKNFKKIDEKLSGPPSNNFEITKICFKTQISSQIVSRKNSCIRKNEKRSDQNVLPNELNLTVPFGFDMPKKRFSVLIQILKYTFRVEL